MRQRSDRDPREDGLGISVVVLLATTLTIVGPSIIFLTNAAEFSNTTIDLLLSSLVLAVLSTLVAVLILVALRAIGPRTFEKGLSLLFAVSFLLWFQGNILKWDYGPLDGRDILWSKLKTYGYIDGSIWLAVMILAVLLSSWLVRIARKASTFLVLLQLLYLAVLLIRQPETPSFKQYSVDTSHEFVFSQQKNVIIIVLDSYQADVFQEIINGSPEFLNSFDGFTYFRNGMGGYPFTELSVITMLTGRYYDNSLPFESWKRQVYTSNSVPHALKADGWRVDLFPKVSYSIYYSDDMASNLTRGMPARERFLDVAYIYDISLFRCLPHFLKQRIYNNQDWFLKAVYIDLVKGGPKEKASKVRTTESTKRGLGHRQLFSRTAFQKSADVKFVDAMLSESTVENTKGAFKYYHLGLPHWPLNLNERLEFQKMAVNRENYRKYSTAALKLMLIFLHRLEELGIYDNSLIFIVGDHGSGNQGQDFVPQPGMPSDGRSRVVSEGYRVCALPLILVKPFKARGALKISDAPVSLSDIPATVYSEVGLSQNSTGVSMFAVTDTDTRERRFLRYAGRDVYSYYGDMVEYLISGYAWLDGAWRRSGKVFTKDGVITLNRETYRYGSTIAFKKGGNALPYLEDGWTIPGKDLAYTEGERSLMVLPVQKPQADLTLKVSCRSCVRGGDRNETEVLVSVNGRQLGKWIVKGSPAAEYEMTIPKDLVDSSLRLEFDVPAATSTPVEKLGRDVRRLGLAVTSIVVDTARG